MCSSDLHPGREHARRRLCARRGGHDPHPHDDRASHARSRARLNPRRRTAYPGDPTGAEARSTAKARASSCARDACEMAASERRNPSRVSATACVEKVAGGPATRGRGGSPEGRPGHLTVAVRGIGTRTTIHLAREHRGLDLSRTTCSERGPGAVRVAPLPGSFPLPTAPTVSTRDKDLSTPETPGRGPVGHKTSARDAGSWAEGATSSWGFRASWAACRPGEPTRASRRAPPPWSGRAR